MAKDFGSALLSGFGVAQSLANQKAQNRAALDMSLYREAATQGQQLKNQQDQAVQDQYNARQRFDTLRGSRLGNYVKFGDDGQVIGFDTDSFLKNEELGTAIPMLDGIQTFTTFRNKDGELEKVKPVRIKALPQTEMVTPASFDQGEVLNFGEVGDKGEVEIKRLGPIPEEKETGETVYAIEVERPDGSIGVITQNATDGPDDQIQGFTKDQLNGILDSSFNTLAVKAGIRLGDARDMEAMGRAQRDAALANMADQMTLQNNDPSMGRQFLQSIQNLGAEEQDQILAEAGFDVSQFKTPAPTPSNEKEDGSEPTEIPTVSGSVEARAEAILMVSPGRDIGIRVRRELARKRKQEAFIEERRGTDFNLERAEKNLEQINGRLEKLTSGAESIVQEQIERLEKTQGRKMRGGRRQDNTEKLEEARNALVSISGEQAAPATPAAPAAPGAELKTQTGKIIPADTTSVAKALRANDLQLTEQQRSYIRTRLEQQGIRTLRQAGRLPTEDQIRIAAFIAASDLGGSTADRVSTFYSSLNGMQTGDPESTALKRGTLANQARNTGLAYERFYDGQDKTDAAETEKVNTIVDTQRKAIFDEQFNFLGADANTTDSAGAVENIFRKARVRGPAGNAAREAQQLVLYNHLAAQAAANGAPNIGDWLMSFFTPNAEGVVGGYEGRAFMRKNAEGVAQEVVFTDANDTPLDFALPWSVASKGLSKSIRSAAEKLLPELPQKEPN